LNATTSASLFAIANGGAPMSPTLKARILIGKDKNQHGLTSGLDPQEVDDLVAYVRSL